MDDLARVFDEDLDQETPAAIEDLAPTDPAAIVFTSGTTGEPRGVVYPQRYLAGQRLQAEHWFGAREGERRLVHGGAGLVEVDPQRLHRPLAGRRRRRPPRRPLRPRRAAAPLRGARRQRPLPGADRVPDAGQARRAGAGPLPAPPGLRRRADRARRDPPLPRAARPGDRRRLRPDRDRRDQRHPPGRGRPRPRRLDGPARCPAWRPGSSTASCSCAPPPPPPSSTATSTASRFEGEWWPTGDRVREDDAGYLWFEGRSDDLILSSGYRIGPFEVESALVSHPAVAEAAAVAAPDPERGSVVRAIVVLHDGSAPSERARRGAAGARQGPDRALQVPAHRRVRGGAAEDQPAARSGGRSCAARLG